jgi:hypothetical protein
MIALGSRVDDRRAYGMYPTSITSCKKAGQRGKRAGDGNGGMRWKLEARSTVHALEGRLHAVAEAELAFAPTRLSLPRAPRLQLSRILPVEDSLSSDWASSPVTFRLAVQALWT